MAQARQVAREHPLIAEVARCSTGIPTPPFFIRETALAIRGTLGRAARGTRVPRMAKGVLRMGSSLGEHLPTADGARRYVRAVGVPL